MDLSSIEQIIRTRVPNAQDSEVELYLDSVKRDMKFGADYSDMSEDDIVEDFEFYFQSKMDEVKKPSMKMKKSELKEMIKAAFLSEADFTNAQDDDAALGGMYDPVYEGEDEEESLDDILARITGTKVDPYLAEAEEEETDMEVDAEEETDMEVDAEEKTANDSIVVDKKIVSLSSLPSDTRKILDSLETLRAQAEEFGDQKFITQVGNTITFFTRDFVVAGDEPTKAKVDETKESLNEDLTSTITILLAFLIGIPGVPIAGALIMGLINYLFNELPEQRAEAKSLRSYKGPDRQEKVLALAKEIESKLSPGKKRYLKTLISRIGAAKLEDKAREYRELDRYASSQKSQMDRELDENLNADIEAALEDLPVPTDMENDKEFLNESVAFPLWNKIK
jgi:hypothetical protein